MDGDPDRTSLVGYGPGDGLADPPRGVGRELEALAVVELLDGPHQPDVALLDQIEQRDAPSSIFLGFGEMGLGAPVASLYTPREVGLLGFGKKGCFADLVQVHLDRVPRVAALQVAFEHLTRLQRAGLLTGLEELLYLLYIPQVTLRLQNLLRELQVETLL